MVLVTAPNGAQARLPVSRVSRLTPAQWRGLMDALADGAETDPESES